MLYVALRNMSLNKPGNTRDSVPRPVSGLTALTVASQRPGYLPMPGIVVNVRDQADHRCGGSAGIAPENSPDFPLIRPAQGRTGLET